MPTMNLCKTKQMWKVISFILEAIKKSVWQRNVLCTHVIWQPTMQQVLTIHRTWARL